jgi:hypothetical protein
VHLFTFRAAVAISRTNQPRAPLLVVLCLILLLLVPRVREYQDPISLSLSLIYFCCSHFLLRPIPGDNSRKLRQRLTPPRQPLPISVWRSPA